MSPSPSWPLGRMSAQAALNGNAPDWLRGHPTDPRAQPPEPLPTLPGMPFAMRACSVSLSGPSGDGKSLLAQAAALDAAVAGLRVAYLGSEVGAQEWDSRAAAITELRGDDLTDELCAAYSRAEWIDLEDAMSAANTHRDVWRRYMPACYDVLIIDPLSYVAAALGLNFDSSAGDYTAWYVRLVQPLVTAGMCVILLDNTGHAEEARTREQGTNAKGARADIRLSCESVTQGLLVTCRKVRPIRAPFKKCDQWIVRRDDQRIEPHEDGATTAKDRATDRANSKQAIILNALPAAGDGAIRPEIIEATGQSWRELLEQLNALVADGSVEKTGKGKAGSPYRYRLTMSVGTRPPQTPTNPTEKLAAAVEVSVCTPTGTHTQTPTARAVATHTHRPDDGHASGDPDSFPSVMAVSASDDDTQADDEQRSSREREWPVATPDADELTNGAHNRDGHGR